MPKILDDQLFATLQEYEEVKGQRLALEKDENKLREELDMKFSDYDESEVEVSGIYRASSFLVKYTPTERRSLSRERLIESGVSLDVLLYATDVTQSRRLTFKRNV